MLVLGASGFLGGRLVERLVLECDARVRAVVRRVTGATRIARLPVEVVLGDALDPAGIATAAEGCTLIFNCAKGTGGDATRRRAVDVDGARYVVEAAARVGARVVHVSTMAVYALPRDGEVDERSPDTPAGDPYADGKLAGERAALELGARERVPVSVVQPTVVYGPHGGVHGADILDELRSSRVVLVDGGTGICNAVYVDDAVTGLLLAATSERAPGERFLISGPEHPTWLDFFGAFERMLGVHHTVSLTEAEALELWVRSRRRAWLLPEALRLVRADKALRKRLLATREGQVVRRVAERLLPKSLLPQEPPAAGSQPTPEVELPLGAVRPWVVQYLAKRARVRIDKARELLGYQPRFPLEPGMLLTEAWARWAGLLG